MQEIISCFYDQRGWDALAIGTLVLRLLMLLSSAAFVAGVVEYFRHFKIIETLFVRFSGNVQAYDRARRSQMRAEIEDRESAYTKDKKKSFLNSIYELISKTGITEQIPGFSEAGFLITIVALAIGVFFVVTYHKGTVIGIAGAATFLIVVRYGLSLVAYNRKVKLEKQLLQFSNACASASMQYANLIDIFGVIYEQFSYPLREGLEACYVEAKQTSNRELAIKHLKERYDSVQFAFVVDNMNLCSTSTGNYQEAAKNISDTVSIYSASYEKKRVLLRNAKINITAMFGIGVAIFYAMSMFLDSLTETLFNTTLGNLAILVLVLLYFYGMNIKTDD